MGFGDVEGFEESCSVVCHVLDGVVARGLAGLPCVAVVEEDELVVGSEEGREFGAPIEEAEAETHDH
jgi:hypothetical protein